MEHFDRRTTSQRVSDKIALLEKGIHAVLHLIENSQGVAGLHLNGDVAPWDELRDGGQFEAWLYEFDKAIEAIGAEPTTAEPQGGAE